MNFSSRRFTAKTKHQTGVVLVAVIVFLLIASILIAGATKLMESRLTTAKVAQDKIYTLAIMHSKLNEITYALATQRQTIAGLSQGFAESRFLQNDDGFFENRITGDELRVDGYVYKYEGINFYIQNTDGLIPINTSGQTWLKMYLGSQGVSDYEAGVLLDSLHDYADEDNLQKGLGKELLQTYTPRNYLLQTCTELNLVNRWKQYLLKDPYLQRNCNLARTPTVNLNVMPVELWRRIYGGNADTLSAQRNSNDWFVHDNDASEIEPRILTLPDDLYTSFGGNEFIIKITQNDVAISKRIKVGRGVSKPFTKLLVN